MIQFDARMLLGCIVVACLALAARDAWRRGRIRREMAILDYLSRHTDSSVADIARNTRLMVGAARSALRRLTRQGDVIVRRGPRQVVAYNLSIQGGERVRQYSFVQANGLGA